MVVSVLHSAQMTMVSARAREPRRVLHGLQRLGSFLNCFSLKKTCSPAVKTNSLPHSIHFKDLSENSIFGFPVSDDPEAAVEGWACSESV